MHNGEVAKACGTSPPKAWHCNGAWHGTLTYFVRVAIWTVPGAPERYLMTPDCTTHTQVPPDFDFLDRRLQGCQRTLCAFGQGACAKPTTSTASHVFSRALCSSAPRGGLGLGPSSGLLWMGIKIT